MRPIAFHNLFSPLFSAPLGPRRRFSSHLFASYWTTRRPIAANWHFCMFISEGTSTILYFHFGKFEPDSCSQAPVGSWFPSIILSAAVFDPPIVFRCNLDSGSDQFHRCLPIVLEMITEFHGAISAASCSLQTRLSVYIVDIFLSTLLLRSRTANFIIRISNILWWVSWSTASSSWCAPRKRGLRGSKVARETIGFSTRFNIATWNCAGLSNPTMDWQSKPGPS